MRFYRDIDYFLYFCDFPHMGVYGVAVSNTDGTVNVYINTLYNESIQQRTIYHELCHVAKNHLWDDVKTVTQKELEATDMSNCTFGNNFSYVEFSFQDVWDNPPENMIPEFKSLAAFHSFMLKRRQRLWQNQRK